MRKFIYIICPCRLITSLQKQEIDDYINDLQLEGHYVHSYKNVDQNDLTGYNIYRGHCYGMMRCDEVHIFWDASSIGSHVDLGMALVLKKPLVLVKAYHPDKNDKSYLKIIKEIEERGYWQ